MGTMFSYSWREREMRSPADIIDLRAVASTSRPVRIEVPVRESLGLGEEQGCLRVNECVVQSCKNDLRLMNARDPRRQQE